MLGRGERLRQVQTYGIVAQHGNRPKTKHWIPVHEAIPTRKFDWLVLAIRAHQVVPALATLKDARADHILTLANHAGPIAAWQRELGRPIHLGFPGISGALLKKPGGDLLRYRIAPSWAQATQIGLDEGADSAAITRLRRCLTRAGIPANVNPAMDIWLPSHAAWMCPFMLAAAASGNRTEPFREGGLSRELAQAVREALHVVETQFGVVHPAGLKIVERLPLWLGEFAFSQATRTTALADVIRERGEGRTREACHLGAQLLSLAEAQNASTPALRQLVNAAARTLQ